MNKKIIKYSLIGLIGLALISVATTLMVNVNTNKDLSNTENELDK